MYCFSAIFRGNVFIDTILALACRYINPTQVMTKTVMLLIKNNY